MLYCCFLSMFLYCIALSVLLFPITLPLPQRPPRAWFSYMMSLLVQSFCDCKCSSTTICASDTAFYSANQQHTSSISPDLYFILQINISLITPSFASRHIYLLYLLSSHFLTFFANFDCPLPLLVPFFHNLSHADREILVSWRYFSMSYAS